MTEPILFLDVDGVLNPFKAKAFRRPSGYQTHRFRRPPEQIRQLAAIYGWKQASKPLRVWLNPSHGEQLLVLPCELVWATAWEDDANTKISPATGLPNLPVVHFQTEDVPLRASYKVPALLEYAAGRPFIWVDDEIGDDDGALIQDGYPGRWDPYPADFSLFRVDPAAGLRNHDFEQLTGALVELKGEGKP